MFHCVAVRHSLSVDYIHVIKEKLHEVQTSMLSLSSYIAETTTS